MTNRSFLAVWTLSLLAGSCAAFQFVRHRHASLSSLAVATTTRLGLAVIGEGPSRSTAQEPTMDAAAAIKSSNKDRKVVLITGSSQGLGKTMALEMAKHGHKVLINCIPGCEDDARQVVEKIERLGEEGTGSEAMSVVADCSDPDQVRDMFAKAVERFGTVDVLINNAGITRDNLVVKMKPQEWEQVINVNLSGVFYCCQEFFKIAHEGGGRVVNIASVVGQIGNPGQANYAASKGGVIGLTKSFARDYASKAIKVNAICPGFIRTPMTDKLGDDALEAIVKKIPLQRLGKPEEVAAMARFLALDEGADYITGHCFDVDGGVGMIAA
jgi:3-oxoacyl-[acyl-carrier protein] reductase